MTKNKKILAGFVTGTFLGLLLGMLYAPDSVATTRSMIADNAKKLSDNLTKANEKEKEPIGI